MRIACLPIGDLQTPSTWYRIGQYVPFFKSQGITLDFCKEGDSLDSYDLIINQKNLFPPSRWRSIIRHKKMVFDFDDAIWTRPIKPYSFLTQWRVNKRLKFWLQNSQQTFVANQYLANYAKKHSGSVTVLPMSLDLDLWKPGVQEEGLIGWCGAPHNFHYLESMQEELLELKSNFPQVRFAVYSGKKPALKIPFEYVPFQKGSEHLFVQRLQIGLLPLDNDPYSCGKSPIKALQYMACGVPIVSNGQGATVELLQGINASSCQELLQDLNKRAALSKAGRALVEKNHDQKKVVQLLLNHFAQLVS